MNACDRDRLLVLNRRVARAQAIIQKSNTESADILARARSPGPEAPRAKTANLLGAPSDAAALFDHPLVNTVAMTVTWRGSRCSLGYTRLLDLIDRLVKSPRRWISYDRLVAEVWKDNVLDDGVVKVAMSRLRAKLTECGMGELAARLLTSGYRCGYFPDGKPE